AQGHGYVVASWLGRIDVVDARRRSMVTSPDVAVVGSASDALGALVSRLRERTASVAVVGCGYVSLPLTVATVDAGFSVIGFDVDATKIARLRTGHSTIDDVADERLFTAMEDQRLRFVSEPDLLAAADVVVIAVPTPLSDGV